MEKHSKDFKKAMLEIARYRRVEERSMQIYKRLKNCGNGFEDRFFKLVYAQDKLLKDCAFVIDVHTIKETDHDNLVSAIRYAKFRNPKKFLMYSQSKNGLNTIKTTKGDIKFMSVRDYFQEEVVNRVPKLETKAREGQCHWLSLQLSVMMTLNGLENKVVTANVFSRSKLIPYIHTWIEFMQDNGRVAVVDSTMGAVISKEGYEILYPAKDRHEISGRDLLCEGYVLHDLENIEDGWATKLYFMNRPLALKLYEEYFGIKLEPLDFEKVLEDPFNNVYQPVEKIKAKEKE